MGVVKSSCCSFNDYNEKNSSILDNNAAESISIELVQATKKSLLLFKLFDELRFSLNF